MADSSRYRTHVCRFGDEARFSNHVADDRMGKELVVAIPVSDGETVIGAIRVSEPIGLGADRVHRLWYALVGLAVAPFRRRASQLSCSRAG